MTLTFRHTPRISSAKFRDVLAKGTSAGVSPCAPIAFECYDIIAAAGLDPAILLAIFAKESQYGCTGLSVKTRNWGNVRTAFHPELASGHDDVHNFAIYGTWQNGLRDLCDRLNVRYIDERGLTTPEAIFPVYAPPSENDTAGYISFVNAHVATWMSEDRPMVQYTDRVALLKPGANRPGNLLTGFREFVVHETDNEAAGATAEMHRRYWDEGGDGRFVSSVQFVVDALESIQLIPTNEVSWNIGDGADQPLTDDSYFSVAMEICVNKVPGRDYKADFVTACHKGAKVIALVMRDKGTAPVQDLTMRRHGSFPATTHRQCPKHLTLGDWGINWSQFNALVKQEYAALQAWDGPAGTYPVALPLQPYYHRSGDLWQPDRYALGYAISPLQPDPAHPGAAIQKFERAALRLRADGGIDALLRSEW